MADDLDHERLRSLIQAGRDLFAELDPEAVLERLLETARVVTGARYAALGVLDGDRKELSRFLTRGIDEATRRAIGPPPRGRGILGLLIDDPQPLRLADIGGHARSFGFPSGHPPMRSFLGAPIVMRGQAWGNLYLADKTGGEFSAGDEDALVVLAGWAAVAIENARLYAEANRRRAELERAVTELEATQTIALAVGAETDLERILVLIVKRARALVDARSVVILLRQGDELALVASAGDVQGVRGQRIPIDGSTSGEVLLRGEPARVADAHSLRIAASAFGVTEAHTALLVPLLYRGEGRGVLLAFDRSSQSPSFSAEDERLLMSFAASAATAVAMAQTVQEQRLRDSLASSEAERARWSRELHDETLQALAGLRVLLSAARLGDELDGYREAAAEAVEQLQTDIANLRAIITELRPAALDQLGLQPAIAMLLDRHRTVGGLEIDSTLVLPEATGEPGTLGRELDTTVYRLLQEALANIAKHADATQVKLRVQASPHEVTIEVADDGIGFEVSAPREGFGLSGMHERVLLAGGSLQVDSHRGKGTSLRALLPRIATPSTVALAPASSAADATAPAAQPSERTRVVNSA